MKLFLLACAAIISAARFSSAGESKKAVIFVGPGPSWLSPAFLQTREGEEKKYLEKQGYAVQVIPATPDAILDALWNGALAISYFGPGAARATGEGVLPTLNGMTAQEWKGAIAVYFSAKYAQTGSKDDAAIKAQEKSRNLGLALARNFSCHGGWDHSLAELFVRPEGHYWGGKSDIAHNPVYEKLSDVVRGCTKGGDCPCEVVGQYSAGDLKDYELPKMAAEAPRPAGPIAGTWYISPSGTFDVDQRGEDVSWVLAVPEHHLRHEGHGSFSRSVMNGSYADTENPGGLHAGEYRGWQVTKEGRFCGQVKWWNKQDPALGAGSGFDCYSRVPKK